MVNTGKPSRGCYMCRARRIKCDEGKPHCMRCQKSKRECPGYRDAFELKLRDESKSMKKKLIRRLNQQQSIPDNVVNHAESCYGPIVAFSPTSSHSRSSSLSSVNSQTSSTSRNKAVVPFRHQHNIITSHMTTPLQQQAACYFLSNFVLVPEAGTMRGYLDFVLPLMKQDNPQTALVYAFSAVTLAALSTRPNSKGLQSTADLWYLKALKEINTALKDPKVASSEATMASVMLMASFEQLTPSRMKVRGWSSHIDGAVAMIKSSPLQRWSTGVGRDLFIAVRAHMTLHCIANSKPVDPGVDWLGVQAYDDIVQTFAAANLKMAALRANIDKTTALKSHSAENVEKVLEMVRKAQALDQEYIDWIKALPATWTIRTVAWIDRHVPDLADSLIHPGRVDAYGELWMAYKYNIVRACRISIWTIILRCVAWLGHPRDYRLAPEYTTASQVCQQLIEDIVSSVPYFFGWNRDNDAAMADKSNFACGITDYTAVRPLAGLFAMWPLFVAASSDFASPSQRIFLRGRLKYVADMMGINQALILFQIQLRHPSFYIARERMNMQATSCHLSDTRLKIASGVSSASITIPSPPASQDGVTWTASPITQEQLWPAHTTTRLEHTRQTSSAKEAQFWSAIGSTRPQDQDRKAMSASQDQIWSAVTSSPPHEQIWSAITPPQDQLWSSSTSSPSYDLWKTSSPPHTPEHIWASPTSALSQPRKDSSSDIIIQARPDSHNQVYSLPLTLPEEHVWPQPPVTTTLSCAEELMPMHDPDQLWNMGFKDSAPSWIPRTFIDQVEMFEQGQEYEPAKSSSQGFEKRDSMLNVTSPSAV